MTETDYSFEDQQIFIRFLMYISIHILVRLNSLEALNGNFVMLYLQISCFNRELVKSSYLGLVLFIFIWHIFLCTISFENTLFCRFPVQSMVQSPNGTILSSMNANELFDVSSESGASV